LYGIISAKSDILLIWCRWSN